MAAMAGTLGRVRRAGKRNRGREGAREREDRAGGGVPGDLVLASRRSAVAFIAAGSGDEGHSTELLVDQRRKMTGNFWAGPLLGHRVKEGKRVGCLFGPE
jgi:hypothetical protein